MAFLAVNVLGYKMWYEPKMAQMQSSMEAAEIRAESNEGMGNILDAVRADKEWLDRTEPEPSSGADMRIKIQQLAENEAVRAGLTVKKKRFGSNIVDPSLYYHRARYDIEVNGTEASIYRWLDRLHNPNDFRIVTFVRMNPQRDDATRADCQIYLDQWFVPEGGQS